MPDTHADISIDREASDALEHPNGESRADVRRFLEGPGGRGSELARLCRISYEFFRGFRSLHFIGPCVTVFGSARFRETHPHYIMAHEVGAELAKVGFTVMTGGGPGVMEAANRGAREAGGHSVGCNIELPHEQDPNPYLDKVVSFKYFFVRKVMLVKYSYAFVTLPGGFGTMDEIFETATLIQTAKIRNFPLVVMGRDYWAPLLEFVSGRMVEAGTIDRADVEQIFVTDSAVEAAHHIRDVTMERFGLRYGAPVRPRWWLGERMLGRLAAINHERRSRDVD